MGVNRQDGHLTQDAEPLLLILHRVDYQSDADEGSFRKLVGGYFRAQSRRPESALVKPSEIKNREKQSLPEFPGEFQGVLRAKIDHGWKLSYRLRSRSCSRLVGGRIFIAFLKLGKNIVPGEERSTSQGSHAQVVHV